ncbi:hypothetical protein SVIO_105960 [Streptomyces violaceusniger]|uniref:ABC transporter domain-containing protein n=1 Tax=Streptomyces violaceusniger TaxID=68280 RepID=A0A4D4LPH9_STRVO|nr:hypothetical protein SVIO_105960 [Streptomyces violaceusniger]
MSAERITDDESAAQGHARLAARGVTVGYGGRAVIDNLDVTIPPGVITTIIGPNGCGKSTLLRTLTRLLKPAKGPSCWTARTSRGSGPGTWRRSWACCRRRRSRPRG